MLTKLTLFSVAERGKCERIMREVIGEVTHLLEIDDKSPWSADVKASDEVLDRVFKLFFKQLGLPLAFRKRDYHQLARFLKKEQLDLDISEKLDAIVACARRAMARM